MKAIFVSVIKCFLKHAGTGFAKLQKTLGDLNKELPFLIEKVRKRNCFLTSDCRQSDSGANAPESFLSLNMIFKCNSTIRNKRLYVSKSFLEKRQESYENILTETGIQYRMNRPIQIEGAFGVLKNDYEFQKFLLRGKTKRKVPLNHLFR